MHPLHTLSARLHHLIPTHTEAGRRCKLFVSALALLAATLASLAGCGGGTPHQAAMRAPRPTPAAAHAPTATASAPAGPPSWMSVPVAEQSAGPAFPRFADWRVAYIGLDGHLHLLSLDGRTDLTGVRTPLYGPPHTGIYATGTPPDGTHLAYNTVDGLHYLDLATDRETLFDLNHVGVLGGLQQYWSPDGSALAIGNQFDVAVMRFSGSATASLARLPQPGTQSTLLVGATYGWLDGDHLAVDYAPGEFANATPSRIATPQLAANLASLDSTTAALHLLVTLSPPKLCAGRFALAPDGAEALFYNSQFQALPFAPDAERISTATGQRTPLPAVTNLLASGDGFSLVLWLPRTHTALVATRLAQTHDLRYFLLDVDADTLTPLTLSGFPVAWAPDGRTLIVATASAQFENDGAGFADVGERDGGPFTLTALTFDANWRQIAAQRLTTQAMNIPPLGFVRNP